MPIDIAKYSDFLKGIAQDIDIPPSKYQQAVDRYESVGRWLENGSYKGCYRVPSIYTQGSFRLGTVVRPIRHGAEADYDIDLVCELSVPKDQTEPKAVKLMVGNRLNENEMYRLLIDDEGRRCWTLEYAEQDGIGFHMDVLPCVHDGVYPATSTAIAITDKQGLTYTWSASDPNGFAEWFAGRNTGALAMVSATEKALILRREAAVFASIDDVPDQLVRTPLQRSIQIMKRHRDIMFNDSDHGPISMIITTLAGHLYQGEIDLYSALNAIVLQLDDHAGLMRGLTPRASLAERGLIRRLPDGTWYIANPVNPNENFADRWHEDGHARASAFFRWVAKIKEDLIDILMPGRTSPRGVLSGALGIPLTSPRLSALVPQVPTIHISEGPRPWSV